MIKLLRKPWFRARSLAAIQTYLELGIRNPLPEFESRLLSGAVNLTLMDDGTPIDAAFRFYCAYAETAVGRGICLTEVGFARASGRLFALRDDMKFFNEHLTALKSVSELENGSRAR